MSFRKSGKRRGGGLHEPEDLNLLPLMSLFVALVPTLLYSAVFVPVAAMGIDFPGTGGAASATPLALSVRISDDALHVEGVPDSTYAAHPRVTPAGQQAALAALREELHGVRARFPEGQGAILIVSPQVPYRDIVEVMDVVRESGFGNSTLLGAAS